MAGQETFEIDQRARLINRKRYSVDFEDYVREKFEANEKLQEKQDRKLDILNDLIVSKTCNQDDKIMAVSKESNRQIAKLWTTVTGHGIRIKVIQGLAIAILLTLLGVFINNMFIAKPAVVTDAPAATLQGGTK